MYCENPIGTLAECIAHAQYQGFSNIIYQTRDYSAWKKAMTAEEKRDMLNATIEAERRPTTHDFEVYTMYPQTWGSTALGHGGMGAAAVTTAYTVVLHCQRTGEFLVYFGGQMCYKVNRDSDNIQTFIQDCKDQCLVDKRESIKYK